MCGRFLLATPADEIARAFGVVGEMPALRPRYNIAPKQDVLIIHAGADGPRAATARWGLIPSWSKDETMGARTINARMETADTRPVFRDAFRKRRCLVPADGFYEWKKLPDGGKQPMAITRADGRPMGMAGLWETWRAPDGTELRTCTILTRDADDFMRPIHDRMPAIVEPDRYAEWLDAALGVERTREVLATIPGLSARAVGTYVNSPRNDGPRCLEAAAGGGASLFG
jgi:putative SOS response-associated peptidase YedK